MRALQIYSTLKMHAQQVAYALNHLRVRLRYPYALPSEIGSALGLPLDDALLYPSLLDTLSDLRQPQSLTKLMSRKRAECCFNHATRCERFTTSTLCSFLFNEGWVEFHLHFDEEDKLSRLFLIHKRIRNADRLEIPLKL